VLSVLGRLLKDSALRTVGEERRRLYCEAAAAYGRAGKIGGSTYPLINAATLLLLAGQREQAHTLARRVLAFIQQSSNETETPYYRAATRAEALLLLGKTVQAKAAFADAMSLAPRAFEDHASTLRQFTLILDELGEDKAWLEPHRPPRTLHYAGHMATSVEGDVIGGQIRKVIREERIGFGYGALAAGADIHIAEALLKEGAELHLILPATLAKFREMSVTRFGDGWAERFDRILEAADSIRAVGTESNPSSTLALQLAAEVAMGCAVMQADALTTDAVQLLILDQNDPTDIRTGSSDWIGSAWGKTGHRQHVLAVPRVPTNVDAMELDSPPEASRCLAAILRIKWPDADAKLVMGEIIPRLADVLANGPAPIIMPRLTEDALLLAFGTPTHAACAAVAAVTALAGVADICVAGHYGIALRADDPFGGAPLLLGPAAALPGQILLSTPPGAVHLSEDFAMALHAGPAQKRPRIEYIGELPTADTGVIRLYALIGRA